MGGEECGLGSSCELVAAPGATPGHDPGDCPGSEQTQAVAFWGKASRFLLLGQFRKNSAARENKCTEVFILNLDGGSGAYGVSPRWGHHCLWGGPAVLCSWGQTLPLTWAPKALAAPALGPREGPSQDARLRLALEPRATGVTMARLPLHAPVGQGAWWGEQNGR